MPAFFAGLGVVFIRSMTAISATIFLVSISWTLITVRILENMTELSLGPAAAFSVFVIVVVFVVVAGLSAVLAPAARAGRRRGRPRFLGGVGAWRPSASASIGISKRFDHTREGRGRRRARRQPRRWRRASC